MDNDKIEIIDEQHYGFFITDNVVIDDYLDREGMDGYCLAVYTCLKRYAGNKPECWPTIDKLVKKLKWSKPTINKALKVLVRHGLVIKKNRTNADGGKTSNLYRLPALVKVTPVNVVTPPMEATFPSHGSHVSIKNTHSTNTGIVSVLDLSTAQSVADAPSVEEPVKVEVTVKRDAIDKPVKDAIGEHVQGVSEAAQGKLTGILAGKATGVWKRLLNKERLSAEQYAGIGRSILPFVEWYRKEMPNAMLPSNPDTFESYYARFADGKHKAASKLAETKHVQQNGDGKIWVLRHRATDKLLRIMVAEDMDKDEEYFNDLDLYSKSYDAGKLPNDVKALIEVN